MTDKDGENYQAGSAGPNLPETTSKPQVNPAAEPGFVINDREKKLFIFWERKMESRITSIIRQESGDTYAGLPADHVLINLDRAFPDVRFPERMMARLEAEQSGRLAREKGVGVSLGRDERGCP